MLAPTHGDNLQNALNRPIFELQTCYLPKNWSEFQSSVTLGRQNVIYDVSFGENSFFSNIPSASPLCSAVPGVKMRKRARAIHLFICSS